MNYRESGGPAYPVWEYHFLSHDRYDPLLFLNHCEDLGLEGWEMVSHTVTEYAREAMFKRLK
jgi:hypothetical protein